MAVQPSAHASVAHRLTSTRVSDHGARVAAGHIGCTVEEYREHEARDEHWCGIDQEWHPRERFGRDASRASGLAARCRRGRFSSNAHGGYRPHRSYFLTAEGAAAVVSHAEPIADASVDGSQHRVLSTTAASSCHPGCRLWCGIGCVPAGWVREAAS